ncbi:hypothetical protein G3T36_04720 [Diaminobutyricibacter tongyongensis]|uniref:Uncharacterized protein n=1 Tax=Leifsonia tongyongensis TaxID=1268043 RepID=A0A6L9XVX9_9MICO|nr:hypothetical protein [Diaminobutyricibacter tongyongensis]NEN05168.1 hypothetical protein [Diaminobutyricibacter tongyongensis]
MGTFEGPTDGGDRDRENEVGREDEVGRAEEVVRSEEEGFYTEVNDEGGELRTVHGSYTETEDNPGTDPLIEGEYTETELNDEVVESSAEQGDYTERDQ